MTVGSLLLGVMYGLLTGLLAVGVVLIYRSDRVLNLAQGAMGTVPALVLAKLVLDLHWTYWLSLPTVIVMGAGFGVVIERFFVVKLRKKTRSTASFMLLTLALAQILAAIEHIKFFQPNIVVLARKGYPVPAHAHFEFGGVLFHGADVSVLIAAPIVVGAVSVFLRYSLIGKMIRANASNRDYARLCGIYPRMISGVAWGMAGGLAALSAVLSAPAMNTVFQASTSTAVSLGPDQLFLALGAAAFGSFVSMPMALLGGVAIGVANQLTLSATSNGGTARLVVFLLILAVIFVRGPSIGKVFALEGSLFADQAPPQTPSTIRDRLIVRRHGGLAALVALVVALLLPFIPLLQSEGHRFELTTIVLYATIGVSLTLLLGWAGQLSLGQFAIVGVAAFAAARLAHHGWSLAAILAVCGSLGALTLVAVGFPALRVRGLSLAVTTLGFSVVASEWLFHSAWFTGTSGSIQNLQPIPILSGWSTSGKQLQLYLICLALLCLVVSAIARLRKSTPGRLIIAVRDDERAAAAHAISPTGVKIGALAVSGFIAGMVGGLWADVWTSVSPDQFSPTVSLSILAIPVIGGLGSVWGAVIAAVAIYLPTYFISPHLSGLFGQLGDQPAFQLALGGVGMLGALLSYPSGIAGAVRSGWANFLQRLDVEERANPANAAVEDVGLPVLEATGIHLAFGGVQALRGASVAVGRGEIVGLIGPNGAGKTTLLNAISGVFRASHGDIRLMGTDVSNLAPELRASFGLARSFQAAHLFAGLTVRETVETIMGSRRGVGRLSSMLGMPWSTRVEHQCAVEASALIERMGLVPFADVLTAELSTGTRRICDLALQVADQPKVLLLDEPTAGIAQREAEAFGPLLKQIRDELDCSILIVEHDMPLLMGLCDRVYAMELGEVIAEGTPQGIRQNPKVVSSYLGTDEVAIARSGPSRNGGKVTQRRPDEASRADGSRPNEPEAGGPAGEAPQLTAKRRVSSRRAPAGSTKRTTRAAVFEEVIPSGDTKTDSNDGQERGVAVAEPRDAKEIKSRQS